MAKFCQRDHLSSERNLFHHGLIRILVEFQLKKKNNSWESFISRNDFLENPKSTTQNRDFTSKFKSIDSMVSQTSVSNCLSPRITRRQFIRFNLKSQSILESNNKKGYCLQRSDSKIVEPTKQNEEVPSSPISDMNFETPISGPLKGTDKFQVVKAKRQGRLICRKLRNKSRKVSNFDSPITIIDDEHEETEASFQSVKKIKRLQFKETKHEKFVEEKKEKNVNVEAKFWKDKYFNTIHVLQANALELEIENIHLKRNNKTLIDEYEEKIVNLNKKLANNKDSVSINSPGVNIFASPYFKTSST